ncbi:MAG: OmpH family outer membrane protein [Niabella sp.]
MKQALLIVNVLLIIAVSYLLYKQFSNNGSSAAHTAGASLRGKDSALNKKVLIAYINMDSIQNKYTLAKQVAAEVDRRRNAITNEITKMETAYKNKVDGYQKKGPSMNEQEVNAARQDLDNSMRQMNDRKQSLDEEFGQWVRSKNLGLMKDIQDYLKKYNADGTYSFIFSYEPGLFYYKDTAYDITRDVLQGLNDQYEASKRQ